MELWVVFLPLLGAMISGFGCRILSKCNAHAITCACIIISTVISWISLIIYTGEHTIELLPWINMGGFRADWVIYSDILTCIMFVVVTSVSALVHVYSIGYMIDDPYNQRFFSYLSLFTFCMLMLVSSNNFIQLFFGWEGVGLCSYLLIGFWFKKESANSAAMKAFVVNRVGDFGLALGIFTVYIVFGSVKFAEIFNSIYTRAVTGDMTLVCMLLFMGCMGKSAQIGLHTWLPDAMEGPTPVSALIHAATMVTAGVFLVARCYPLFELSPFTLNFILVVGAITSIFAGTVAMVQTDIKKIIAYSTCSQLGYMFMACGSANYAAAIFHLTTHAFFKALLFLCAGNVIYAAHHKQNIYDIRCNWRDIPVTYFCMWVGSLALAGLFPFAGFYSKDMIIEAIHGVNSIAWVTSMVGVVLTAIYSWRLILVVFHKPGGIYEASHSVPKIMALPLILLSIISLVSGYIMEYSMFANVNVNNLIHHSAFWGRVVNVHHYGGFPFNDYELLLEKVLPLVFSVAGLVVTYLSRPLLFGESLSTARLMEIATLLIAVTAVLSPVLSAVLVVVVLLFKYTEFAHNMLLNQYYFNAVYRCIFVIPMFCVGKIFWKIIDVNGIDRFGPNGLVNIVGHSSHVMTCLHSGRLSDYTFIIFFAMAVCLTLMIWF